MSLIYIAINSINGDAYIGKTTKTLKARASLHRYDVNKGSVTRFHRAIRKYGFDIFEWDILEEVLSTELNDAERFWIAYYKYIGAGLYNMTPGGDGAGFGNKPSKAAVEALRQRSLGNKYFEGRKHSDKTKQLMSERALGKRFSEESRAKMAEAKAKTFVFVDPNGHEAVIHNMHKFCRDNNLSQSNMATVATGKAKSHKGWRLATSLGVD